MAPSRYLIAGVCLFASAFAEYVAFTEWPNTLVAGNPVTLRWIGDTNVPTTITLKKGASTDLQDVQVLTSDATGGELTWTPSTDLENGDDYAFQVSQGDEVNYSSLVPLSGGSNVPMEQDRTLQTDAVDVNSSASATDASSTGATDTATATDSMSSSDSMTSSASDASSMSGTVTDGVKTTTDSDSASSTTTASMTDMTTGSSSSSSTTTTGSEDSSTQTESSSTTTTAKASNMNTPFVGSKATSTSSAESSVQTDAAGRSSISQALIAGSAAFLFMFLH